MKLVTFLHDGQARLGALHSGDLILDLNRAEPRLPASMIDFLEGGDEARRLAEQALRAAPADARLRLDDVPLLAPVPRPGKIMCIGLNYRDHAQESNAALPEYPVLFAKYATCVIGPNAPIVIPKVTHQVDYEAELGVVIGTKARRVSEGEALRYVGGYVPFNDVSARDYQMRTSQWTIGKTFDTFGPMGPALTTADEIPDPHGLDIRLRINGEVLQSSNTRNLIFTIQQLIAYLSEVMTLEPGDLIATGTPGGVGMARSPQRWLEPGDVVQVEIEKLEILTNPVVAEA